MMRVIVWGACVLAGCGRIDYAPVEGSGADAGTGTAETLSFGEAPGADVSGVTSDTLLNDGDVDSNYGAADYLDAGTGEAGLLRFELTAIPAGAEVQSATLRVWPLESPGSSGEVSLYRVLEAWQEGDRDGDPGVANWSERLPGVEWTDPGVGPGSRGSQAIFTFSPEAVMAYEVPLPAALVQDWVSSPGENHGLLFTGSGYSMEFSAHPHIISSEGDVPERRPALTVRFSR